MSIGGIDMSNIETFTHTSDGLYDRHHYELIFTDGRRVKYTSWSEAYNAWMVNVQNKNLVTLEVLDIPKKRTKAKGF